MSHSRGTQESNIVSDTEISTRPEVSQVDKRVLHKFLLCREISSTNAVRSYRARSESPLRVRPRRKSIQWMKLAGHIIRREA